MASAALFPGIDPKLLFLALLIFPTSLMSGILTSLYLNVLEPSIDVLGYLRPALGYGVKAHLGNLVAFLNYRMDIFLVNLFVGPGGAGLYSIAVRLVEQLWMISRAVSTVLLPRLSAMMGDDTGRRRLTR